MSDAPESKDSPKVAEPAGSDPVAAWQQAIREPVWRLRCLAERRMEAAAALKRMQGETISINGLLSEAEGVTPPFPEGTEDTTHYLDDTNAWLNIVNKLCASDVIIAQVVSNANDCLDAIDALISLTNAFRGKGKFTEEQAWWCLGQNIAFLDGEDDKERQMRSAGYR